LAYVAAAFEELDWCDTPLGLLTLRRRRDPVLDAEVYEVKLGEEFLMSSRFTTGEVELARLGLATARGADLDVAVGGLGLGYTAGAALTDGRVRSLHVVEGLPQVIDWHRRRLLPEADRLVDDPRTRLLHGDFFALVEGGAGFDPDLPGRRYDVVLVDIDHSPRHPLHESHARFYEPAGLARLARLLQPGGVLALWSDDPPDEEFGASMDRVFGAHAAHVVEFGNPYTGGTSANTVYVAGLGATRDDARRA
jgi:spermidine synthase